MQRRKWHVAVVAAASAGAAAVALAMSVPADAQSKAACADGTTVQTDKGAVCGTVADGVKAWLGVPYAASPVGELRWAPPEPHAAWTSTLEATERSEPLPAGAGPRSRVGQRGLPAREHRRAGEERREAAAGHGRVARRRFPVRGAVRRDASRQEGGVINVGVQYRLGVFGFLAQGLGDHSGNYALRDQRAALRWVRRNIARFGGDPHNVTIYGASSRRVERVREHRVAKGEAACSRRASRRAASTTRCAAWTSSGRRRTASPSCPPRRRRSRRGAVRHRARLRGRGLPPRAARRQAPQAGKQQHRPGCGYTGAGRGRQDPPHVAR